MAQDRASWRIKDEAIIDELVNLLELSDEEATLLGSMHTSAQASTPQLTEEFYKRLFKHENTAEYLHGVSMERLNGMLSTWFVELFSGMYDKAYAKRRITIGQIHVRIGLPLRYPLAMMDVIIPFGEELARKSAQPEAAIVAFRKVLALDVAIFNQAYEDNQIKHLAELVGGERLARLLLSGGG